MKLPSWVHFTISTYGEHPVVALAMLLVVVAAGGAALFHWVTISAVVPAPQPSAPHTIPHTHPGSAPAAPAPRVTTPGYPPSALPAQAPLLSTGSAASSPSALPPTRRSPEPSAKPQFVAEPEFVAEPGCVVTVAVPEPKFTGSDRLCRLAAVSRHVRGNQTQCDGPRPNRPALPRRRGLARWHATFFHAF